MSYLNFSKIIPLILALLLLAVALFQMNYQAKYLLMC